MGILIVFIVVVSAAAVFGAIVGNMICRAAIEIKSKEES